MCATITGAHMRFIVLKFILKFGCDTAAPQVLSSIPWWDEFRNRPVCVCPHCWGRVRGVSRSGDWGLLLKSLVQPMWSLWKRYKCRTAIGSGRRLILWGGLPLTGRVFFYLHNSFIVYAGCSRASRTHWVCVWQKKYIIEIALINDETWKQEIIRHLHIAHLNI